MSFCTKCGTQLPGDARFCPECGQAVGLSMQPNEAAPLTPGSGNDVTAATPPQPVASASAGQTDGESPYVGLGRRFTAHLIDGIIVFILFYAIGMQVAGNVGAVTQEGFALEGTPALVAMGLTFLASLLYFMLTEGRGGQSLGKKALGIQVVGIDGTACTMRQAFMRNFLRLIDGFACYLVGIILIVRSDKKQRLGDRVADTVVIRKDREAAKGSFVYRSDDPVMPDRKQSGKIKVRSSWGIKKGRDVWDD